MGKEVSRYADEAMFQAVPLVREGDEVKPRVQVIAFTPDPLRVAAAVNSMYRGQPRTPDDISRIEAKAFADQCTRSAIAAPLEWVQIALLFEGVSRAFTHQLVRQRTATYTQESLRFAVKDNAAWEVVMPPSLSGLPGDSPARAIWEQCIAKMAWSYNALVAHGIPAEDARGLLPTNIATRVHYRTNLRDLIQHSGLRLCSQAQHEWKQVWVEIIRAILKHAQIEDPDNVWQYREIVRLFRPICYQTGKCEFMGAADRWCVIRDRVEAHRAAGEGPEKWDDIDPHACLHPEAARRSALCRRTLTTSCA